MENNIPLERIAVVDDIVKIIIFLVNKRSTNIITLQIIKVEMEEFDFIWVCTL